MEMDLAALYITWRMGLLSILAYIYQALSSRNAELGSVLPLGVSYEICVSVIQSQHFCTDRLDTRCVY